MSTILIVDDESHLRRLLGLVLREEGHAVLEAESVAAARAQLAEADVQLVITDQKLGDGDGLAVLAFARELAPVIFLTAFATVELAVTAMRAGAFDVIAKPFDPDAVKAAVRRALDHAGLLRENQLLRAQVKRLGPGDELVGDSTPMRRLRQLIARLAPTDATALITGETGTGKELVARAIHRQSARAGAAFVAVNCAAMAEGLLESELFGHEKGAFTGADRARPGMFEAASGGTLFLDEAGEMSPALQAKLLRVLTDGVVTRVGSRAGRKVDVRLLVATHRDLPAQVRPARSARTSTSVSRWSPSRCRRSGSTWRICPRWSISSSRAPAASWPSRRAGSRPPRSRTSRATVSPATSASCRTSSSAPASSRQGR